MVHVELHELVLAYRKAKADIFYTSGDRRRELADYEANLVAKLECLQKRLKSGDETWKDPGFLGGWHLAPASLSNAHCGHSQREVNGRHGDDGSPVAIVSDARETASIGGRNSEDDEAVRWADPLEQWQRRVHTEEAQSAWRAEFRVMARCSIDFHVVSTLWMFRIGAQLDKRLSDAAIGSRLRRTASGEFSPFSTGSFPPYLARYRKWQDGERKAIEHELSAKRPVLAVSADFAGFYHSIDASFLEHEAFLASIGLPDLKNDKSWELHRLFVASLRAWSEKTQRELPAMSGEIAGTSSDRRSVSDEHLCRGLPVGLPASAVVANLALHEFDRLIEHELKPVYYGRYVDDLSIVLRDDVDAPRRSGSDLWKWIAHRFKEARWAGSPLEYSDVIGGDQGDPMELRQGAKACPRCDSAFDVTRLCCPYLAGSDLQLSPEKSRQIHLAPGAGDAIMRSLQHGAERRSSEWRMLPILPRDPRDVGGDVFQAVQSDGDQADSLRKVDALRARRAGFALKLRDYGSVAADVDLSSWKEHFDAFVEACSRQILAPKELFDFWSYVPRLVGLVAQVGDWEALASVVKRTAEVVNLVAQVPLALKAYPRIDAARQKQLSTTWRASFAEAILETIVAAVPPPDETEAFEAAWGPIYKSLDALAPSSSDEWTQQRWATTHDALGVRDLGLRPYRHAVLPSELVAWPKHAAGHRWPEPMNGFGAGLFGHGNLGGGVGSLGAGALQELVGRMSHGDTQVEAGTTGTSRCINWGLAFPTRPISVQELVASALSVAHPWQQTDSTIQGPSEAESVAFLSLDTAEASLSTRDLVVSAVSFARGYSVDKTLPQIVDECGSDVSTRGVPPNQAVLRVGTPRERDSRKRSVALAVVALHERDLVSGAEKRPCHSLERHQQLARLLNDALRGTPELDYVVFPELAMPAHWFMRFASKLSGFRIGLISGVDHIHVPVGKDSGESGRVWNQIWVSLNFDAKDFVGSVVWRQNKLDPAPPESDMLIAVDDLRLDRRPIQLTADGRRHPIFDHQGFRFSILNCVELTDISQRAALRGAVDAVVVPEWNKDVGSFSSLVETAANDVHAFVVQCNIRKYGDSRIRAPYKQRWARDVVRVTGGSHDLLVRGQIDFGALRVHQTQRRAENPIFKPCPSGFVIAAARRLSPSETR